MQNSDFKGYRFYMEAEMLDFISGSGYFSGSNEEWVFLNKISF